jgi:hypothetical protein
MGVMLVVGLVPLAYLVTLGVLFARGRRRGLAVSLLLFALALGAGSWAILQSRSSTAGIGFLFLPFIAVLAGVLGWVFRNLQAASDRASRLAGWACLASAVVILGWELQGGAEAIARNRARDAEHRARSRLIDVNKAMIDQRLRERLGHEAEALAQLIREHAEDAEFLLPALASRYASPDDLDRFARKDELSLTLTTLRNPNCRADTLIRIHRTHTSPDYFLQALAAHPHTPPELLREIHDQSPRRIGGLDIWLARNPATPPDLLLALARSTDVNVIQGLLQNPALTCALLPELRRSLARSTRPADDFSTHALSDLDARLCR